MASKYLVTTAIDYVNDVIHIGHAYEKIVADCFVRHVRLVHGGENIYFVTGTDEHGQKVQKAAENAGITPKEFADKIVEQNKKEFASLQISYDRFIRTTDEDHVEFVHEFWNKVKDAGFIYEGEFTGLYCEGDEAFITPSELVDGKCPNHPNTELKNVTEKNYFFKWHEFAGFLGDYIAQNEAFIPSKIRRNEMLAFLDKGLTDITVSRTKEAVSWGIPVPGDDTQVIYVWFDALINYLTAGLAKGFWDNDTTVTHFVGKDILRWHALLWPAMLDAALYKLPDTIVAHGFLELNGQKISKSIGNVIRPSELVEKYGTDVIRYYLLRYTRLDDDADLSIDHLEKVYNADLANGLGNLVARIAKLCETSGFVNERESITYKDAINAYPKVQDAIEAFDYPKALGEIWAEITALDVIINTQEPWSLIKEEKLTETHEVLGEYIPKIITVATLLQPFMPKTSETILEQYSQKEIKAQKPLFPRLV